jgi:hypothetical protein
MPIQMPSRHYFSQLSVSLCLPRANALIQVLPKDRYSRIDDMNSSDARAILAQTPCDFNGGEICMSFGTWHNILLVRQHDIVQTVRDSKGTLLL